MIKKKQLIRHQVFQSNTNNFQISIQSNNGTRIGTTTSTPSRPGSNWKEGFLYSPQINKIVTMISDAVKCYVRDTPFLRGVLSISRAYNQFILNPGDRVVYQKTYNQLSKFFGFETVSLVCGAKIASITTLLQFKRHLRHRAINPTFTSLRQLSMCSLVESNVQNRRPEYNM